MKANWQYFKYVIRHKWYVFIECVKLGIIWRGIIHDWHKFLPSEWEPYATYFYRRPHQPRAEWPNYAKMHYWGVVDRWCKETIDARFNMAWLHHQKRAKHHWQYWILTEDWPNKDWVIQEYSIGNPPILAYRGEPLLLCEWERGDDAIHTKANRALRDVCSKLNTVKPLPMPEKYRKEMLADWRGAGRALGKPDTLAWYKEHRIAIQLHPETRRWIEEQLGYQE